MKLRLLLLSILSGLLLITCSTFMDMERPKVRIISPTPGFQAFGMVHVQVEASDNKKIDHIDLFLDCSKVLSAQNNSLAYDWDLTKTDQDANHTIVAKAFDPGGNWDDAEVNFFGYGAPPSSPELSEPADASIFNNAQPVLKWSAISHAQAYHLKVGDSLFVQLSVNDTTVTANQYAITTSLPDATYSWMVRARYNEGNWSGWSGVWTFSVDTDKPPPPNLIKPENGNLSNDPTPKFDWSDIEGVGLYSIIVDNDHGFLPPYVFQSTSALSFFDFPLALADSTYYWKVQCRSQADIWGDWSDDFLFIIDTQGPSAPDLISPSEMSTTTDHAPSFDWSDVIDAWSFELLVDNDSDFNNPEIKKEDLQSSQFSMSPTMTNGTYYWKVRARDAAGNFGKWSVVQSFIIYSYFLEVSSDYVTLNSLNSSQAAFSVISNTEWTVSADAAWFSLSVSSGSNNGTVLVRATMANTSTDPRSGTVTLSGTGVASKTVLVTQVGAAAALMVFPESLTLDSLSSSQSSFQITSNCDWTVNDDAAWLSVSPSYGSGNGTVTVTAYSANTSTSSRNAIITVNGTGAGSRTVSVSQNGVIATLSLSAETMTLDASENSQSNFSVNSNCGWTVSDNAAWLMVSPSFGSNNGTVTVTAATANTSIDSRSAIVTVAGEGAGSQTIIVIQNGVENLNLTDIDGNVYKTVQIGEQIWMAENMEVTHYRNGDAVAFVSDNTAWSNLATGAYCNYGNNSGNVDTYGRLYNWYVINDSRNIAPAGWHVPTDEDWKILEIYLGMSRSEADGTGNLGYRGTDEGAKLKESGYVHWNSPNTGATNESEFTALPAGYRYSTGGFNHLGYFAFFWSSTSYNLERAWDRSVAYDHSEVYRNKDTKRSGYSIRLIKDN